MAMRARARANERQMQMRLARGVHRGWWADRWAALFFMIIFLKEAIIIETSGGGGGCAIASVCADSRRRRRRRRGGGLRHFTLLKNTQKNSITDFWKSRFLFCCVWGKARRGIRIASQPASGEPQGKKKRAFEVWDELGRNWLYPAAGGQVSEQQQQQQSLVHRWLCGSQPKSNHPPARTHPMLLLLACCFVLFDSS